MSGRINMLDLVFNGRLMRGVPEYLLTLHKIIDLWNTLFIRFTGCKAFRET